MIGEFAKENRIICEKPNMAVLIEMPVAIYQGFLGRRVLASRKY